MPCNQQVSEMRSVSPPAKVGDLLSCNGSRPKCLLCKIISNSYTKYEHGTLIILEGRPSIRLNGLSNSSTASKRENQSLNSPLPGTTARPDSVRGPRNMARWLPPRAWPGHGHSSCQVDIFMKSVDAPGGTKDSSYMEKDQESS